MTKKEREREFLRLLEAAKDMPAGLLAGSPCEAIRLSNGCDRKCEGCEWFDLRPNELRGQGL